MMLKGKFESKVNDFIEKNRWKCDATKIQETEYAAAMQ